MPNTICVSSDLVTDLSVDKMDRRVSMGPFSFNGKVIPVNGGFMYRRGSVVPGMVGGKLPVGCMVRTRCRVARASTSFFVLRVVMLGGSAMFRHNGVMRVSGGGEGRCLHSGVAIARFCFHGGRRLTTLVGTYVGHFLSSMDGFGRPAPCVTGSARGGVLRDVEVGGFCGGGLILSCSLSRFMATGRRLGRTRRGQSGVLRGVVRATGR